MMYAVEHFCELLDYYAMSVCYDEQKSFLMCALLSICDVMMISMIAFSIVSLSKEG